MKKAQLREEIKRLNEKIAKQENEAIENYKKNLIKKNELINSEIKTFIDKIEMLGALTHTVVEMMQTQTRTLNKEMTIKINY